MDIMIKALHSRGHSVDVVRTNKSWYIKDDLPHYKTITVPVAEAFDRDFINPILKKIIDIERGESSAMSFYQAVCDEFFSPEIRYSDLLRGVDIWLMRVDFVFEFPRPTMPNVVYMGGFQCKPAKPLPQHLEEFKVIWRHKGDRPAALGNNTLLVDWMPQNDLLGHPKVKLFVAHGGTNGVQEAIYHGVPVVGLPLFFDQYDNLLRLTERGAAKMLTIETVDKDNNFLKAVEEVLTEPSYRINMHRLSRLHRDQPMKPLDTALFWIEFVMRHKGAAHLRSESYKLPWYSYHSVDICTL
ncbi:UDP-glucuronosyltransferase 2A1-like [Echeneis naucrates]|uniref:UDP-glucuronosyltransferase 2A1-like n=1 Tax=Echeneis naucrates TaxID=173247 RepID=UPI0011137435|nr:UDP-glucuronosyltransferase 2A1-like [Echeneis naucrates]